MPIISTKSARSVPQTHALSTIRVCRRGVFGDTQSCSNSCNETAVCESCSLAAHEGMRTHKEAFATYRDARGDLVYSIRRHGQDCAEGDSERDL